MVEVNQNKTQTNELFWFGISLVAGAIAFYWWMKNELDRQKKELEIHLAKQDQELTQVKLEKEQELKKIQELEQQLIKLNEELNKKNNLKSNSLINYLSQWFKKNLLN